MSMTVHIAVKGVTDLEILMEALGEMGIKASTVKNQRERVRGTSVLAVAHIDGQRIGFVRNQKDELTMVGYREWRIMRSKPFQERLQQQCSLASVKRKVTELRYHVASVSHLEDGSIRLVARAWG